MRGLPGDWVFDVGGADTVSQLTTILTKSREENELRTSTSSDGQVKSRSGVFASPSLPELLAQPERISALPLEAIPEAIGQLERLKAILLARLTVRADVHADGGGDHLLTIKEAAAKLNCSEAWLYREAERLPFTVRVGRKLLFSEAKMESWINARAGR